MKTSKLNSAALVAALPLIFFTGVKPAVADSFSAQYFQVATGTPDFYNGDAPIGGSFNYVLPTLGPDGFPVFNPSYSTAYGQVYVPNSIYLNGSNELLYWDPANPNGGHITPNGSGTIAISSNPLSPTNMFAPDAGGVDSTHQETGILSGTFTVTSTENVAFTVAADDDAYVYVFPTGDPTELNSLVASVGGIHTINPTALSGSVDTGSPVSYTPGTYTIEIFYADRDTSYAELAYSDSANLNITPLVPTSLTPEPSTFLLLGTGLLGAAGTCRRRFAR